MKRSVNFGEISFSSIYSLCIYSCLYTHSICVAGYIHCHDLQENCTHPPPTAVGGNCSYGDKSVHPGELTIIVDEGECKVW